MRLHGSRMSSCLRCAFTRVFGVDGDGMGYILDLERYQETSWVGGWVRYECRLGRRAWGSGVVLWLTACVLRWGHALIGEIVHCT